MSHQRRLAVVRPSRRARLSRRRRRGRGSGETVSPAVRNPARGLAATETECDRRRDGSRTEDQAERQHYDLVGETHEGEADRREQGDDRVTNERLRKPAFTRSASDQVGDDPGKKDPDDNDQGSEDHFAAKRSDLREEDRDVVTAELPRRLDRRGENDRDHRDVGDDSRCGGGGWKYA